MTSGRRLRATDAAAQEATTIVSGVAIDSIAGGGDGVARIDGVVVFVPRTAPGDIATVRFATRRRGRFARGELVSLDRPSADRVPAPCPHYTTDRCGGCQLQHLGYAAQVSAKGGIVRDALTRIGRRRLEAAVEVGPSDAPWRYRQKLTLALRRRPGGAWVAGLHAYDDPVAVFALTDCPITDARVMAVWRAVLDAIDADPTLLPDTPALRASVRLLDAAGRAALTVEGGDLWPDAERLAARVPVVQALWWRRGAAGASARLVAAPDDAVAAARVGASFAQVNARIGRDVHDAVVARAMAAAPRSVIDAYAGVGETAAALAARGVAVTAIERDPDAARWCAERLSGESHVLVARVEEALAGALPVDLVILNPPRAGVAEPVTDALAGPAGPATVLYVSCDPATLARDLARLAPYELISVESFDMFPQTAHVETLCVLRRASTRPTSPASDDVGALVAR
jgi:23S rRNA (uracil1939-C5)-methyltransferase